MGDINEEEVSLDGLAMEQITKDQLTKMASDFREKMTVLGEDITDALKGGNYAKGEKAIKEIRNELHSGAIANFVSSKSDITSKLDEGAKYGNPMTAEQEKNFNEVRDFIRAYSSTADLRADLYTLLTNLLNGTLECSYQHNLFILYFDFVGLTTELRHELCNVFRQFEKLATYYKDMDFNATDLAFSFRSQYDKEIANIHKALDEKMARSYPDAYKYLDPFKCHSVNEAMSKMKTIDRWTSEYVIMQDDIPLFISEEKLLDKLYADTQAVSDKYQKGPYSHVVAGFFEILRHISWGMKDAYEIILKLKEKSDDNPYWIMKFEDNIISTKNKYGIGFSTNPMTGATDYYDSFRHMTEKLRQFADKTIDDKMREIRRNYGIV